MEFSDKQILLFDKLKDYYKRLAEVMGPRVEDCGPCIDCCAYLVSTVPSPLEIDYSRYYLSLTGNPDKLPLFTWEDYLKKSGGLCAYINPEKKSCTLYEARFNICRIYGPYIPDTDITMYGKCVYKGKAVPRCFKEKAVPFQTEFQKLVEEYLELVPGHIRNAYKDITSFGITAEKRLEYTVERYEKLVSKYPDISDLHFWLGRAYIASGKIDKGLSCFEKSLTLAPEQIEAYLDAGLFHYQQGNLKEAEATFRKALEHCPNDGQSRYLLILTLIRQNRIKDAALEFSDFLNESFLYEEKVMRERELLDLE